MKLDTYIQGKDNEGRTALFGAAELGWEKVVTHLLERGADPKVVDAEGMTAFDAAMAPPRTGPGARRQDIADRSATVELLGGLAQPEE